MNPRYPGRVYLAHLPTPLERLDRLGKHLGGPELLIKRDDQTGLALGGNKVRKLEFLAADALEHGCDHLITSGGPQSNHCRQTAAVAARLGLGCSLVLRGQAPIRFTGNLLLDRLFGAHLYWAGDRPLGEVMSQVAGELRAMGRKPYLIPLGGSNVVGATGYVMAMEEFMAQLAAAGLNVDFIVFASSSGGTQAGLVLGARVYAFRGRVLGISVDRPAEELQTQVAALATATATHLGLGTVSVAGQVEVNDDYLGEGYGVLGEAEREAIRLVAQLEGILLDPVYTGRAMGGLIDLIRWGAFTHRQTVLFWHTGGTPALFAYGDELLA
ncbi:MAG: D-cysteine desulfhydrase family protein [Chloroflexi bacterium]|nr:D-cysteine desulfhydrase family protein [Chloroflexota bacterium]MCI0578923.1 D-cysteine desulfhydrase family protein [Chloroflexota bacterium]MCI0643284.1 D-cysteine desulfhydrase family protein [Chloroflexota bacterium]